MTHPPPCLFSPPETKIKLLPMMTFSQNCTYFEILPTSSATPLCLPNSSVQATFPPSLPKTQRHLAISDTPNQQTSEKVKCLSPALLRVPESPTSSRFQNALPTLFTILRFAAGQIKQHPQYFKYQRVFKFHLSSHVCPASVPFPRYASSIPLVSGFGLLL